MSSSIVRFVSSLAIVLVVLVDVSGCNVDAIGVPIHVHLTALREELLSEDEETFKSTIDTILEFCEARNGGSAIMKHPIGTTIVDLATHKPNTLRQLGALLVLRKLAADVDTHKQLLELNLLDVCKKVLSQSNPNKPTNDARGAVQSVMIILSSVMWKDNEVLQKVIKAELLGNIARYLDKKSIDACGARGAQNCGPYYVKPVLSAVITAADEKQAKLIVESGLLKNKQLWEQFLSVSTENGAELFKKAYQEKFATLK